MLQNRGFNTVLGAEGWPISRLAIFALSFLTFLGLRGERFEGDPDLDGAGGVAGGGNGGEALEFGGGSFAAVGGWEPGVEEVALGVAEGGGVGEVDDGVLPCFEGEELAAGWERGVGEGFGG